MAGNRNGNDGGGSSSGATKNKDHTVIDIVELKKTVDVVEKAMTTVNLNLQDIENTATEEKTRVNELILGEGKRLDRDINLLTVEVKDGKANTIQIDRMLHRIAGDLVNVGNSIKGYIGDNIEISTTTLGNQLKKDKEIIEKATKNVVDGYTKLIDRIDSYQLGSLSVLPIIFVMNVLFFSHTPPPGTKMEVPEFVGRLCMVIQTSAVLLWFLWILFRKIIHIDKQLDTLRDRFQQYKELFKSLSGDKKEQLLPITDQTTTQKLVTRYNNLDASERISTFEAEVFNDYPIELRPSTSKAYLCVMGGLIIGTTAFMIYVCFYQFTHITPVVASSSAPPPHPFSS